MHSSDNINVRDAVQSRNYLLVLQVGTVGIVFLSLFGINALFSSRYHLGTILLLSAAITVASMAAMHLYKRNHYGANGVSIAAVLIFTYLIVTGGMDNTGPLWCYPLALVIMPLQGFRRGVQVGILLLIIVLFLMYVPGLGIVSAEYSDSFKLRFCASFFGLLLMSFSYEYLRWQSQEKYIAISRDLDRASRTDALTGLANRRDMQESLDAEYSRFIRHGHPFSIIMIDLDHFKDINDRYGHVLGDKLLVKMGQLFCSGVRLQDTVARWGGEEFLILLPQTNLQQAMVVAEKLRDAAESMELSELGLDDPICASFGVQCACKSKDLDDLILETDRRLYRAKRQGRNRVVGDPAA